jgi:predicted MPP superfamily phosphohydrolase
MSDPTSEVDVRAHARRHWRRASLLVALAVLVSVGFGVTTATAQLSLGPHEARYDITTDSTVTVDLGPLGTLQLDSPLPLTLGVRVTVQEIPSTVTQVGSARTLQALSNDLQSYLQFFAGPQATITAAAQDLAVNAAWRAAMMLAALVTVYFGLGALLGQARRADLGARLEPHTRQILAGGAIALLVMVAGTASSRSANETSVAPASTVFDGTPLAGARVTGRLGGVIDTYGGYVVNALRQNEEFYARANKAFVAAWSSRETDIADAQKGTPAVVVSKENAPVVLLVVSDLHCNVGMAPLIREAATLAKVDVILNAGDSTLDGTAVEKYCVDTFAAAAPKGVPTVVSGGNHDSTETAAEEAKAGMTVLDGQVVTVKGIRILGDSDPNATRIGAGTKAVGKTVKQVGQQLADVACGDADGVDILLIHTPRVGNQALDQGCVPAQISGHLHIRRGPVEVGDGVRYISSSTAGAKSGEATVGPLHGIAEMTVLRFDPVTRRIIDYQVIQVHPDTSATVGYRFTWPSTQGLPGILHTLLAPAPAAIINPTAPPTTDPLTGAGQPEPTVPLGE